MAKMNIPTSTNKPTRSSVQVNCLRCGMADPPQWLVVSFPCPSHSNEKTLQISVRRLQKGALVALKIHAAVAQHEKVGCRHDFQVRIGPAELDAALTKRNLSAVAADGNDLVGAGIESKICQRESVLEAVRGEQSRDPLGVTQTQDQPDDSLRSHRVEPSGRRIVKHDRGAADQ